MRSTLAKLLAVALLVAVCVPAVGVAKPTAKHLPDGDWAYEHWFPFEESTLYSLVGGNRDQLRNWIGDGHTVGALGRRRGYSVRRLTTLLTEHWRGRVSKARYRMFRARTRMVLTDNFLDRHFFGHQFHTRSLNRALPKILREPMPKIIADYARGKSWVEIGMSHGRSAHAIHRAMLRVMRRGNLTGVRRRETSRKQARVQYGFQKRDIWRFATRGRNPGGHHH